MVDGGVELRIGVLPLAIQILSAQRAAMAGAGKETAEERKHRGSVEESRATRKILPHMIWPERVQSERRTRAPCKASLRQRTHEAAHVRLGGVPHSLSVDHAVGVQHGHDLEDVGLPQARC